MSLIHEALEKVEQEKNPEPLPKGIGAGPENEKTRDGSQREPSLVLHEENRPRLSDPASRLIYGIAGTLAAVFILGVVYLGVRALKAGPENEKTRDGFQREPSLVLQPALSRTGNSNLGRYFSLTGISQVGSKGMAIVNNQLVRVGDEVSGAKVTAIGAEEVTLEFRGETLQLSLYR